jgi:hypothetical protein
MPQTTPTPPTPPATPQADGLGAAIREIVGSTVGSVLQTTRTELESKLASMQAERAGLAQALASTDSRAARASIQARMDRLDRDISETQRSIERINSQIDRQVQRQTDVRVSTGTNAATTVPPDFPRRPMDNFDPLPIVATSLGILFVAFPLTLAIVRFIWKRSTSAPAPALSQEQTRRFDRLEQSVDAIAIEVERISENQRYLTKLLAEPRQAAKIEA